MVDQGRSNSSTPYALGRAKMTGADGRTPCRGDSTAQASPIRETPTPRNQKAPHQRGFLVVRSGAGEGNSTRSLTRLLRTFFPIQASRNGLDCGLKSSAWSTQAVAGDPKRAKHIHQQPEHRISFGSLSVYWHTTPQVATDRRAAVLKGLALHRPVRPRLSPAR